MKKLTWNPKHKGLRSFVSFARRIRPSSFPFECGNTSKTMISRIFVSKGFSSKAKKPGFSTAQTYKRCLIYHQKLMSSWTTISIVIEAV